MNNQQKSNIFAKAAKSSSLRYIIAVLVACGFLLWPGHVVYADVYVTVTGSTVNVRSAPEIDPANRITTVPRGTIVRIVDISGDFFRAHFPDIGYAYISVDWVQFLRTVGTITESAVWVYDLPDIIYGTPISLAFEGDVVTVTTYDGNWYGILYNGQQAFIERRHIDVADLIAVPPARRIVTTEENACLDDLVTRALALRGRPYRWGGSGPYSFDCSGFVLYVLRPFGLNLPRRSRDMANSGVHVARSNLAVGDLVFFATGRGSAVSHVGLYIGDGQFIHSSTSRGVIVTNLNSAYWSRTFVTARRVL